ncbi:MAG: TetR/AcrR family transcriptional regulator [Xanthomonadales bacterium]|nr:TetR/AcrR family transcriptional regulator [Xanthomonadales bacterium]
MKTSNDDRAAQLREKTASRAKSGYVKSVALLNPRGLRSRERLKEAAREVLNEKGYHSLRVQDITERAGAANGLYYRYFHDLREIVAEISSDFFDELIKTSATLEVADDPYNWIYRNHHNVVSLFAQNPGILACLFGLAGDYEEFDAIWKRNAHEWNLQVAGFLQVRAGFERSHAERMGFVLGAITEGVIYQALIRRTEDLFEFGSEPKDIAETIAVMWYRAIFLENPPVHVLGETGRHLAGEDAEHDSDEKSVASPESKTQGR